MNYFAPENQYDDLNIDIFLEEQLDEAYYAADLRMRQEAYKEMISDYADD